MRTTETSETSRTSSRRYLFQGRDFKPLDLRDLVLALALGALHGHRIADLLADHGARDRRTDRDPSPLDVGLVLADDRVGLGLSAIGVLDGHGGAEFDPRTRQFGWIDHLGERELGFQLADLGLDQALLFLGSAVVGVLGQIAMAARDLDRAAVRQSIDVLQLVELRLHRRVPRRGHRVLFAHHGPRAPTYSYPCAVMHARNPNLLPQLTEIPTAL